MMIVAIIYVVMGLIWAIVIGRQFNLNGANFMIEWLAWPVFLGLSILYKLRG